MYIKNNSTRLITINLNKGTIKIVPTTSTEVNSKQFEEMKKDKIVSEWFKCGDLEEVTEKDPITAEMFSKFSLEQIGNYYNIKELREFAKSIEVQSYSKLEKDELLLSITDKLKEEN